MTSFTDEDLKSFKERIQARGYDWDIVNMRALLARLESAEALLDLWLQCDDDCEIDGSVFDAAMETWRKAAGK